MTNRAVIAGLDPAIPIACTAVLLAGLAAPSNRQTIVKTDCLSVAGAGICPSRA